MPRSVKDRMEFGEMAQDVANVPGSPIAKTQDRGRPPTGRNASRDVYGALDLGTNNCRLLIARPSDGGFTVIDLLAELSSRIPVAYKVKVVRLVADAGTVRMKGITSDFNTVDNILKELQKSPYFHDVVISSANQSTKGDEVNFEMKLDITKK